MIAGDATAGTNYDHKNMDPKSHCLNDGEVIYAHNGLLTAGNNKVWGSAVFSQTFCKVEKIPFKYFKLIKVEQCCNYVINCA